MRSLFYVNPYAASHRQQKSAVQAAGGLPGGL